MECDKTQYFWGSTGLGRHEKILNINAEYYPLLQEEPDFAVPIKGLNGYLLGRGLFRMNLNIV